METEESKVEEKKLIEEKEEEVKVSDILEVFSDNLVDFSILLFLLLDQAKVLQIKENKEDKAYYVHFLNLEKRMDKWVTDKHIKSNLSKNKDKVIILF